MFDEVWPETDWALAGFACRANDLHDRADGALGHTVELMHVRRAGSARDGLVLQVFRELAGHELAGVVQLQLSHDAHSLCLGLADVADGVKLGDESLHAGKCFAFLLQEVDLLEA